MPRRSSSAFCSQELCNAFVTTCNLRMEYSLWAAWAGDKPAKSRLKPGCHWRFASAVLPVRVVRPVGGSIWMLEKANYRVKSMELFSSRTWCNGQGVMCSPARDVHSLHDSTCIKNASWKPRIATQPPPGCGTGETPVAPGARRNRMYTHSVIQRAPKTQVGNRVSPLNHRPVASLAKRQWHPAARYASAQSSDIQ